MLKWPIVLLAPFLLAACATLPPAESAPAGRVTATVTSTPAGTQITLTFTNTSSAPIYFTDSPAPRLPSENIPPYIYFDQTDGILLLWALPQPNQNEWEAGVYRIQRLEPGQSLSRTVLLPPKLYEAPASAYPPVPQTPEAAGQTLSRATYHVEKTIRRVRVAVGYFSQQVIAAHHRDYRTRFPDDPAAPDEIYKNAPIPLADLSSSDFTSAALASIIRSDQITAISCPWDCQAYTFSPAYPIPEQKILLYDLTHGTGE